VRDPAPRQPESYHSAQVPGETFVIYEKVSDKDDFDQSVRPLMKFLGKHCHPHMKAIVESNNAELVEGTQSVVTDEYIVD